MAEKKKLSHRVWSCGKVRVTVRPPPARTVGPGTDLSQPVGTPSLLWATINIRTFQEQTFLSLPLPTPILKRICTKLPHKLNTSGFASLSLMKSNYSSRIKRRNRERIEKVPVLTNELSIGGVHDVSAKGNVWLLRNTKSNKIIPPRGIGGSGQPRCTPGSKFVLNTNE